MKLKNIPEIDIIIAVSLWLHSNGYILQTISIPKGKDINSSEDEQKLKRKLCEADVALDNLRFKADGPDIVASFNDCCWKIECKGLGRGKDSTLRNNFDRALASAVSYYDSKTGLRLGLALPKKDIYLDLVGSKIPQVLREILNLWIFLYDSDTNSIEPIEPTQQIQSKRIAEIW